MIIELSKFNSNAAFSNGDWTNTFPPIIVEPNGSLSFKGGFLDYSTSSQQVIELPEDTPITMTVGFYYRVPYIAEYSPDGQYIAGNLNQLRTFDLYVARNQNDNYKLINSTITFTIPAGNYSPDEITEIINVNCVRVPTNLHGCGSDFNNNAERSFFRSTTLETYTCKLENIPPGGSDTHPYVYPLVATDPSQLKKADGTPTFSVGDHIWLIDLFAGFISMGHAGAIDKTEGTITSINYDTGVITIDAESGTFPGPFPINASNTFMVKNAYLYEGDDKWSTTNAIRFYKQATTSRPFDNTNYLSINPDYKDGRLLTSMMGASQFQLEYDFNNNSLFQWSYLHTPFYITAKDQTPQEAVDYYFAGYAFNNAFSYVNSLSGVFFTDLQPRTFFSDILGFDLTKLIVSDDPTTHILSAPLLEGINITGNLVSNDALYDKSNAPFQYSPGSDTVSPLVNNVQVASTQVSPIVATKTQGITTSSFYLIEIGGLADINMVSDTKLFRTIAALGSKEYSNAGVISIYPDGTSFYTNNSPEPAVISSFRVRILDSISKQPSTNLGGRNSIFLELINPPPQIPRPIPQPKEKNKKQIKDKSNK